MIQTPALVTFTVYFILLTAVGLYFYRKTAGIEEYLLGGRGLGVWVTAISAQASDMSGWLLMGLPGAVYADGMPAAWIAIGLFAGTACNWKFVSARLRLYTEDTGSLTLSTFFEQRFRDPSGLLRVLSAVITLVFFTIYASSGLVAAGKLFETIFGIDYFVAVFIGLTTIVVYTFLGGFLAVSWTDLIQGSLMFVAIILVPLLAWNNAGGAGPVTQAMAAKNIPLCLVSAGHTTVLSVVSAIAWGLGYFGQPHILARFMGISSASRLPRAMTIALVWVALSLAGAVAVGITGTALFTGLSSGDEEKIFIFMINRLFNPWTGGMMLAAILAAIMSTIDSQLLVSSSTLTEDFYQRVLKKKAGDRELVLVGRLCVIIISLVAFFMALSPESTVLGLVAYAWGGLGAAFGPLVLFALFSKKTGWRSALAGMVTGTVVLILWKQTGLGAHLYEIVPGFFSNCAVILIVDRVFPERRKAVTGQFDRIAESVKEQVG